MLANVSLAFSLPHFALACGYKVLTMFQRIYVYSNDSIEIDELIKLAYQ